MEKTTKNDNEKREERAIMPEVTISLDCISARFMKNKKLKEKLQEVLGNEDVKARLEEVVSKVDAAVKDMEDIEVVFTKEGVTESFNYSLMSNSIYMAIGHLLNTKDGGWNLQDRILEAVSVENALGILDGVEEETIYHIEMLKRVKEEGPFGNLGMILGLASLGSLLAGDDDAEDSNGDEYEDDLK